MIRSNKKSTPRRSADPNSRPRSLNNQQYYQSQTQQFVPPKKSSGIFKKSILWIVFLGLCSLLLVNLFLSSQPTLTINSQDFRLKADYQSAVQAELSSLSNKNKLTISKKTIADNLKDKFPEISKVDIMTPLIGSAVAVSIEVIEPKLSLRSGNNTYQIDERGRAVAKNTTNSTSKYLVINDQSGFEVEVGKQVLTAQQVKFMVYINQQANSKNINIKELVLPVGSAGELFMYLQDKPYFVKFIMDDMSADVQLGTYLALINELVGQGKQPNEYIDVRVEGKAFIK